MCLGKAWICLEWYQGTGIGYHEFLLVHEAYKLGRVLVIKERNRRGLIIGDGLVIPAPWRLRPAGFHPPEPGRKELKLLSALRFFLLTYIKNICFYFRGCNDDCVGSELFSLAIIQRYRGVMFAI